MDPLSRVFISYAGKDRAWAEWARWHLSAAGHDTELDTIDWPPGTNSMEALHPANPLLVLPASSPSAAWPMSGPPD